MNPDEFAIPMGGQPATPTPPGSSASAPPDSGCHFCRFERPALEADARLMADALVVKVGLSNLRAIAPSIANVVERHRTTLSEAA